MYSIGVKQQFIAQHFLFGGDWGMENFKHSHQYEAELILEGRGLNEHGYLFDIAVVNERLRELADKYEDKTLNDLQEFKGLNPSLEHFCRIYLDQFMANLEFPGVDKIGIKMWEDVNAWASFSKLLT